MQKEYNAKEVEKKWQNIWKEKRVYSFDINSIEPVYSIDTPPPFTSGTLHLGHIYNHVWIDIVARYKRMQGFNVYLPQGFDCHGLPTELKVENELKVNKKNRKEFLRKCEEWTNEAITKMKNQFDAIGYSTDWEFSYRTMDPEYKAFVQRTLIEFFKRGLLYREKHPVLWCPKCETALAKAEVGYIEKEGKLYYIDLDVKKSSEKITIATTRPEMMPSCVAVFVHPEDERYKDFVGKKVKLPIFDRDVDILSDPAVDKNFGSGVVYLCTFGDEQDILWQKKYSLPVIISINPNGTMNDNAGKYSGMTIKKAREAIIKDLSMQGRIKRIENLKHNVLSHTERASCKAPIELLPLDQWFIKVREFKGDIIEKAKEMKWYPNYMLQRLVDWTDALDWDWIISRQRIFGTPIPFWICSCGNVIPANENELPIDPRGTKRKCPKCKRYAIGEKDVCDCWIDSSVTPLIISKFWKDESFFNKTYPCSLRPQGYEIIRTWAFYTIFRNLILTKKSCFKELLINGMVSGADGRKMSKSLGNIIAPEEPLEKYSADALRQWAALGSLGEDYPFSWEECKHSQAFLTKLWNIARFIEMHLKDFSHENSCNDLREVDKAILSKLQNLKKECEKNLDSYVFNIPLESIRTFLWHELADNYLEMVKHRLYKKEIYGDISRKAVQYTLYKTFTEILKMLSLFVPHICEEIWQNFSKEKNFIVKEKWPKVDENLIDKEAEEIYELATEIISEIRKYKSSKEIPLVRELDKAKILINKNYKEKIEKIKEDISATGKIKKLEIELSEIEKFRLEF
ncbi:MAG: valine--tRNA ligase [Candidatus Altiarchaeota archaeon]